MSISSNLGQEDKGVGCKEVFSTGVKEGELFEFLVRMSGQQMTSCIPDTCNIRGVLVWKVKVKFVRQIVVFKKKKKMVICL